MNSKLLLLTTWAAGLALQLCPVAAAQTFDAGLGSPILIPDDNSSGIASQIDVSGLGGIIHSVTVTLDITGDPTAYNGDYYAYLQFGPALDVLLTNFDNGTGNNAGNGMDITFSDTAAGSIQTAAQTPPTAMLTGTYAPDASLDGTFGGLNNANGTWTLFVADDTEGGVGQLADWSITLAVPDHGSTLLLLGVAVGLLAPAFRRRLRPD